jgi:hypothetical protein
MGGVQKADVGIAARRGPFLQRLCTPGAANVLRISRYFKGGRAHVAVQRPAHQIGPVKQ